MNKLYRVLVALVPAFAASVFSGTAYGTLVIAVMAFAIAYTALGE